MIRSDARPARHSREQIVSSDAVLWYKAQPAPPCRAGTYRALLLS